MIAIAVDDEHLMLGALVKAISTSPNIRSVNSFIDCDEALIWAENNNFDIAFLDINMRGMGGLSLAEKLKQVRPECKIVFCTGYEEYALSAFKLHASGYLIKPISAEDVQKEIDNILGDIKKEKLICARCFGNFEVTARGSKLGFKRSKSKELFAFLIDRKGAGVTAMEICIALWGDDAEEKYRGYFYQLLLDVRQALEALSVGEVLEKNNNRYSVNIDLIDCDYYSYLENGHPQFRGEYMLQYGWAEDTCGSLWEIDK